jgi:hypothetical protein
LDFAARDQLVRDEWPITADYSEASGYKSELCNSYATKGLQPPIIEHALGTSPYKAANPEFNRPTWPNIRANVVLDHYQVCRFHKISKAYFIEICGPLLGPIFGTFPVISLLNREFPFL